MNTIALSSFFYFQLGTYTINAEIIEKVHTDNKSGGKEVF